ncbi:MAG: peroxiredoxin family protein, partial [Fidelibacterota bacterium]
IKRNAEIIAVNPADLKSHQEYQGKFSFDFPLLSDPEKEVLKKYNVIKDDGISIQRTVYIIDRNGIIRYAKKGMPSDRELLSILDIILKSP